MNLEEALSVKLSEIEDKKLLKILIISFCCVVCGVLIFTFTSIASWSFPQADDFSHGMGLGYLGSNVFALLAASFSFAKRTYLGWQGTYFSMFLQGFLCPLTELKATDLKPVMIMNALLIFASLFFFVFTVGKKLQMDRFYCFLLYTAVIFSLFTYKAWTEIFYWFSGATSYSFPMSTALFGGAVLLRAKRKRGYVLAAVLAFLASGGSLEVAGTSCWLVFMILALRVLFKKEYKGSLAVFIIAVAGALCNALAPGNASRQAEIGVTVTLMNLIKAAIYTVLQVISNVSDLLVTTPFIVVLLLIFCIGVRISRKLPFHTTFWLMLPFLTFFWPFVCAYPVRLAYCTAVYATYFPNRCEYIEMTVLVLTCVVCALSAGVFAGKKTDGACVRYALASAAVIAVLGYATQSSWDLTTSVAYKSCMEYANGTFQAYSRAAKEIYASIENSDEEDVVVTSIGGIENFTSFYIPEEADHWLSGSIANYYGKNSVRSQSQ